ncbi:hypothetical protein RRG08_022260 [Elysia crispata]|uniref:Uncharacterized protein n=1 Tax=Elysia crispata TaxID=231223 RepID=A0AAE1DK03_9GAST|nr:hypothetical protein RRG08_022260 [Elysia crispata]
MGVFKLALQTEITFAMLSGLISEMLDTVVEKKLCSKGKGYAGKIPRYLVSTNRVGSAKIGAGDVELESTMEESVDMRTGAPASPATGTLSRTS